MFDTPQAAYSHGRTTALNTYGLGKTAGWLGNAAKWGGKLLGLGGKAIGATGIGAPVGAVASGLGAGISSLASGEGLGTAAMRTGAGAISGAMPAGSGFVAGAAMDAGIDHMKNRQAAPLSGASGPAFGPMYGHVGAQSGLPGGAS